MCVFREWFHVEKRAKSCPSIVNGMTVWQVPFIYFFLSFIFELLPIFVVPWTFFNFYSIHFEIRTLSNLNWAIESLENYFLWIAILNLGIGLIKSSAIYSLHLLIVQLVALLIVHLFIHTFICSYFFSSVKNTWAMNYRNILIRFHSK